MPSSEAVLRAVALSAIAPVVATPYFLVFWRWFPYWRAHRGQAFALLFGALGVTVAGLVLFRDGVLAARVAVPPPIQALGWALAAAATVLGAVADRQLGLRVRAFMPFFEPHGRIELRTTGAYGVVRHPIYAAGIGYQVGVCLATGYVAVLVAAVVFAAGASWFTRQEERRLTELLDDPAGYERYRARVPALLPRLRRRP